MFLRDGGTPSIYFFPLRLPSIIGTKIFPIQGVLFASIPALLSLIAVRFTMRYPLLRSTLAMAIGLAVCTLLTYSFIPFAISSAATLVVLSGVVIFVVVFRKMSVNQRLPPERSGSFSADAYERARQRWMWLLRQSIWLGVTVLVAQALQAILAFQSYISVAIPPVEQTPYPLDFFRYQVMITLIVFVYSLAGVFIFASIFCYNKVTQIEVMQLDLEEALRAEQKKRPESSLDQAQGS